MTEPSLALLVGIPCDRATAEGMFANVVLGSFADEWRQSQPAAITVPELTKSYIAVIPRIWSEIAPILEDLGAVAIPNATSDSLANALARFDVTVILAHHVERSTEESSGLEFMDKIVTLQEIEKIAPTQPSIVHLGVCRSVRLMECFKARCAAVRVISSRMGVEPEFFLRAITGTAKLWRATQEDYAEAHIRIRSAMLSQLGA